MLSAWPDYVARWREHGIATRFCQTQVSVNPQLAGIKSLNRLDSVLASSELGSAFNEGFLSDIDGYVIEGTMSNKELAVVCKKPFLVSLLGLQA